MLLGGVVMVLFLQGCHFRAHTSFKWVFGAVVRQLNVDPQNLDLN